MPKLLPYYQVKLTLCRCMSYFQGNPPKTKDEKYAYAVIRKAYEINEKKIEMLDFNNNKKLLEEYHKHLNAHKNNIIRRCYNERVKI